MAELRILKIPEKYPFWQICWPSQCFTRFTNKKDQVRNKKIVKTLIEVFRKIKFLTENYDATFSVKLSTVPGLERWTQKLVFYCQCSQEKWSNGKTMWRSETKIYQFWSEKRLPDVCAFQVISWCKSGFKILFGAYSDKPTN